MRQHLMLLLLLVPIAACRDNEPLPLPPPEPTGPNMSGTAPHRMANCPSAVPGAITQVEPTAGGVDVTVTATGQDAQRRILALAEFHERTPRALFPIPHSGLRAGGSRIGFCPIVHHGAFVTTTRVPGGVRIELRADWPTRVKSLQETVSARAARLPGFVSS
jgi:predicted small lipoprotein YifL